MIHVQIVVSLSYRKEENIKIYLDFLFNFTDS
jgi:hypothetical protein